MIILKEQSADLKSNFDTEEADVVEEVIVNGIKGLYVETEFSNKVAFSSDSTMLVITTDDKSLDLVGLAELIEKR